MEIKQIRSDDGTGTLSYLVTDGRVGLIIDPNREDLETLKSLVRQTGVRVTHIIDTHTHVDHVSAAAELREAYDAKVVMHQNTRDKWKVVDQGDRFGIGETLRANAKVPVDRYVADGDTIETGDLKADLMHTPGHTDNHLTVRIGENLFTGDLLLIGQAGRSDLPGGDPGQQYDSLFRKILTLPDHYRVYPGHDYAGNEYSPLAVEKKSNPFLESRSKEEYIAFVQEFFPPLAEAVAAGGKMTLQCGATRVIQNEEQISVLKPADVAEMQRNGRPLTIIDVREPAELVMTGHIENAINIPVGKLPRRLADLPEDRNTEIVCVCHSGSRSVEAVHFLQRKGYTRVHNLAGGTAGWIRSGLPVVQPSRA